MVLRLSIPRTDSRPEPTRRYDVDWLRVLGMATVFLFHCARFFDTEGWHVKSPRMSPALDIVIIFTVQWMMPLFFILSGIAAYHSLTRRRWPQYLASRFKRLVVPLVFGLLLVPILFSCADSGCTGIQVLETETLGSHTEPQSHKGGKPFLHRSSL